MLQLRTHSFSVIKKIYAAVGLTLFIILTPIIIFINYSHMKSKISSIEEKAEILSSHLLLAGEWVRHKGGIYTEEYIRNGEDTVNKPWGRYSYLSSLSSFSQEKLQYGFRLISVNPKNQKNLPDPREYELLANFKREAPEPESFVYKDEAGEYRYMYVRPIIAEERCLKCHGEKGFSGGDIIGALSLSLPYSRQIRELKLAKVMFFLMGLVVVGGATSTLYVVLGKLFLSPFRSFIETIREAASGNWRHRTDIRTGDEWDELSNTYNLMASTIEHALQENEKLFLQTIQSITSALDARDSYTRGHSSYVALVSRCIAKEMGLSEGEQNQIEISALLHDIGKIGIPDDVLRKPDRLSESELHIIRKHPVMGAKILEPIESLKNNAGVLYHHERYDGNGYPYGLKGEDIPLSARIIAVADAYHAMTSERVYREIIASDEAINIIVNNAGSQFCPQVVEAFLKCVPEKITI